MPLSPEARSERARLAAHARWAKNRDRLDHAARAAAIVYLNDPANQPLADELDPLRRLDPIVLAERIRREHATRRARERFELLAGSSG